MSKTVVIVGSLDTKGQEFAFVKELIEAEGLDTFVVDVGVMGEPALVPDIKRDEVAEAGGGNLAYLASGEHKDEAMRVMAAGLAIVVRRLYDEGKVDGILGMGGGGNTSIATSGMRVLPVGVPKVMVSTLGGGVSAYAGTRDITFMPSIVDVAGINSVSRQIFANAAGAIAGMVNVETPPAGEEKPLVTASMFGNTTACVDRARGVLEDGGYEVLVFHATGIGGKTMEGLITDGYIVGSLDITTTELADEVCGGVLNVGPERCMAASRGGVPAVLVPGCVDTANFWAIDTVPERYRDRDLYQWNPPERRFRRLEGEVSSKGRRGATTAGWGIWPAKSIIDKAPAQRPQVPLPLPTIESVEVTGANRANRQRQVSRSDGMVVGE